MQGDIKLNDVEVKVEGDSLDIQNKMFAIGNRPAGGGHYYLSAGNDVLRLKGQTILIGDHEAGILEMAGDRLKAEVNSAELGGFKNDKFSGIHILPGEDTVAIRGALSITNPILAPTNLKRIALQHDTGDRLVINKDGSFAGGVQIEGETHLAGKTLIKGNVGVTGNTLLEGGLKVNLSETNKFVVHAYIENPITHRKQHYDYDFIVTAKTVDNLTKQVKELERKLAALEEKLKTKVPSW